MNNSNMNFTDILLIIDINVPENNLTKKNTDAFVVILSLCSLAFVLTMNNPSTISSVQVGIGLSSTELF